MVIRVMKIFLYSSSVYSCPFLLISSASDRSIPCLSFILTIFAWNVPFVSLIFWRDLQSFPFYFFLLFLCIYHWGKLSYLSLLFFGTLHSNGNIFHFSPLPLASLLFSAISKAASDKNFALLYWFFLTMVFIPASSTVSWTSVYTSSGTLVYHI